jgi:hypothetical protein
MQGRQRQINGSGIDLLTNQESRPEAKQLLYSLEAYMNTPGFKPTVPVKVEKIKGLLRPL